MTDNKSLPQNDPGSDPKSNAPAEWTIMIYMAGDNNLSDDCVNALIKLQHVPTGDTIHVIAQFDPADTRVGSQRLVMNLSDKHTGKGHGVATSGAGTLIKDRVEIKGGSVPYDKTHPRPVASLDPSETDTADPKTLFDFISWSTENYKANHYMLVLVGHSSGIEQGFLLRDEHPVHSMSLDGLTKVLSRVKEGLKIKLDILGMDACLMSMIEICYELQGLVDVYISSQSTAPNPGWPYADIVDALMNQSGGNVDAKKFAPIVVKEYVNSYLENAISSGLATDLAAVSVDASEAVASSIGKFGSVLTSRLGPGSGADFNKALVHAHWEAQSYNGERFVDLRDFCDLAEKYCADVEVKKAAEDVRQAMKGMVLDSCYCGIDYQYSYGLSIYFPWSTIFSYYENLRFAQSNGPGAEWFHFLKEYVEKTRRLPRGPKDVPGLSREFLISRRDPPYGHGPEGPASSMRNPPRTWNEISPCLDEKKAELSELFKPSPK